MQYLRNALGIFICHGAHFLHEVSTVARSGNATAPRFLISKIGKVGQMHHGPRH